jgi:hypothetical protein
VSTLTSTPTKAAPIALYGGAVLLRFDAKRHRYSATEKGTTREVPSVTQILKIVDKSGPLSQWAANCAAERVSDRAKDVGKLAHAWIEELLRRHIEGTGGEPLLPVNERSRRACLAAKDWLASHRFEPLSAETMIYSRTRIGGNAG